MKVVIEISDKDYEDFNFQATHIGNDLQTSPSGRAKYAIGTGTPLPKGHGDLKDFQKMYADMTEIEELARQRVIDTPRNNFGYMRYVTQLSERTAFKQMLYDAPTIIEADKESGVVFKTICNSCVVCHKETIDPDPFYICDACKEKIKADKGVKRNE